MTALAALRKPVQTKRTKWVAPPLEPGEHLDQPTFHERYSAMPPHVRAELVNGIVHMPSPLKLEHSDGSIDTLRWLLAYHDATPGLRMSDNATVMLAPDTELQPDLTLRLEPSRGGQTRELDGYIHGAPELVVEIAVSTASIDPFEKKSVYARCGVREYLVHSRRDEIVFWFANRSGTFEELPLKNGMYRSEIFPGLWLDSKALVRGDRTKILAGLKRGLASKSHANFLTHLSNSAQ